MTRFEFAWKTLGWVLLGGLVGSTVGILFGWMFAGIFRDLLIESAPLRDIEQHIENAAVALYSHVFIGLGWVGGMVVGGLTGLYFAQTWRDQSSA